MHQNIFQYGFSSQQSVVVPISQYRIACSVQEVRSSIIVLRSSDMLSAIEFHYQSSFNAYKIDNISAERKLAPKLVSGKSPITQVTP